MVLSAHLMGGWDPTFRRGVISRAQRHQCHSVPPLQGLVIDVTLRLGLSRHILRRLWGSCRALKDVGS